MSSSSSSGRCDAADGVLDPRDPAPEARARVRLWLDLQHRFAFRPQDAAGPLARGVPPETLLAVAGGPGLTARERTARCDALARAGAGLVPISAPAYPARLRRLADAPPLLAVCGEPGWLVGRGVALVGSRAASAYGLWAARELGSGLARAGVLVISGLARGVDAAAHRAALAAGGGTVAFQGCGADRVFPSGHRRLAREIAARGAVVSELPPGTPPLPHHFPLRNRLISGLAEVVVVVEARERSGSLGTARHAADQGGDVMAVPGPIDVPTHRGANRLLRDGAGAVTGTDDLLAALGLPPGGSAGAAQDAPRPPGGPLARRILGRLATGPLDRDALGRALGAAPGALALALLELELAGRVVEDRDGRLRPVSPQRDPRL